MWTSVEDGLPVNELEIVRVKDKYGHIYTCWGDSEEGEWLLYLRRGDMDAYISDVTHWQPDPPKEE